MLDDLCIHLVEGAGNWDPSLGLECEYGYEDCEICPYYQSDAEYYEGLIDYKYELQQNFLEN